MKGNKGVRHAFMIGLSVVVIAMLAMNVGYAFVTSQVTSEGNTAPLSPEAHTITIVENGVPVANPLTIEDYDYDSYVAGQHSYTITGYDISIDYPNGGPPNTSYVCAWMIMSDAGSWLIIENLEIAISPYGGRNFGISGSNTGTPSLPVALTNGDHGFTLTFNFKDDIISDETTFNHYLAAISNSKLVFALDGEDPLDRI